MLSAPIVPNLNALLGKWPQDYSKCGHWLLGSLWPYFMTLMLVYHIVHIYVAIYIVYKIKCFWNMSLLGAHLTARQTGDRRTFGQIIVMHSLTIDADASGNCKSNMVIRGSFYLQRLTHMNVIAVALRGLQLLIDDLTSMLKLCMDE